MGAGTRSYDLVTGGAGFIGCNLADRLLSAGHRVVVADTLTRPGSEWNADWLKRRHGEAVTIRMVDVRDAEATRPLVAGAASVYHLAAQVAVTTSLTAPREDLEVNLIGTFNVLEAARAAPAPPPVLFTSTNKVYGGLDAWPREVTPAGYRFLGAAAVDEDTPLDFHSPYGCSKGAADQYVRDYARIFGVPTIVFRMSCIYGERQNGTEDQGWVAHLARNVLNGRPVTIYGDGQQTRDLLWVGDLVEAMRLAIGRADELAGSVFNIGGGRRNVLSVRNAIELLMELAGRRVPVRVSDWRPGDQRVYVSSLDRARARLGWEPRVDVREGLLRLVTWLGQQAPGALRSEPPSMTGAAQRRGPRARTTAAAGGTE